MTDSSIELEFFKAGRHLSSDGRSFTYTDKDLDDIADSYNPKLYRAPLILTQKNDHDTSKFVDSEVAATPLAHGIPIKIEKRDNRLVAKFKQITPEFKKWLEEGRIPGLSGSFYHPESPNNPYPGKWSLRHIAAVAYPAVKGMGMLGFCEPKFLHDANFVGDEVEGIDFINVDFSTGDLNMNELEVRLAELEAENAKLRLQAVTAEINSFTESIKPSLELKGISEIVTEFSYEESTMNLFEFMVGLTPTNRKFFQDFYKGIIDKIPESKQYPNEMFKEHTSMGVTESDSFEEEDRKFREELENSWKNA